MRYHPRFIGARASAALLCACLAGAIAPPARATVTRVGTGESIQDAIDAAQSGDTLQLAAGNYVEQLVISRSLSVIGAGVGKTTVQAPAALVADTRIANGTAIVAVDSAATVTISDLTISGPGSGDCASLGYAVFVGGAANLTIQRSRVVHARDTPLGGCQSGVGIGAGAQATAQTGVVTVADSTIADFQKAGIVVDNIGSRGVIVNNTITGSGPQPIAANGIQVSRGAVATVSGNTVTANQCSYAAPICGADPSSAGIAQAAGILLYDAGLGTALNGNTISNNDTGIQMYNDTLVGVGQVVASGNVLVDNRWENVWVESAALFVSGGTVGGTSGYAIYVLSMAGDVADSTVALACMSTRISGQQVAVSVGNPGTRPSIQNVPCAAPSAVQVAPLASRAALCWLGSALAMLGALAMRWLPRRAAPNALPKQ